ncbi:MAG: adenosine deaminase [Blastocatellia bacterium]|jgi:adenosine deaminase|nr:adenosine deaminase [Blastocatellia bacterium]
MIEAGRISAAPDFADLHRHLGGAVHPKVLFGYLQSDGPDAGVTPPERETIRQLLERFPTYPDLKRHFATRQPTLVDYLELHKLVEPLQTPGAMGYFIYRIIRGARIFEQTSLLELRFSPYLRTDPNLDVADRMLAMEAVLEAIAAATKVPAYAVDVRLLLCLHTALPDEINDATLDLALRRRDLVRGIDVAGPERPLGERLDHFLGIYRRAADAYLPATAHLGESSPEFIHPEFFPYLRRIGHGVQIALHRPELLSELRERGICIELCPSTYVQTGTFADLGPVREVTKRLDDAGVDYCLGTDNPAFNGRYLQAEHEIALDNDLIDFRGLVRCQRNAFKHAF